MRAPLAAGGSGRWTVCGIATLSLLALASIPASSSSAAQSQTTAPQSTASTEGRADPSRAKVEKIRRHRGFVQPRSVPAAVPQFVAFSDPCPARVGQHLTVTVRLYSGAGAARSAAFHIAADPALVRYIGSVPTGGGALLVQPSQVDGELIVYRSSVPEGFLATESLVELEYEALAPGSTSIIVTEARLFDGAARELNSTSESGSLEIE